MFTTTGNLTNYFFFDGGYEDPTIADGWREAKQMTVEVKASGDEKAYSFTMTADDQTPGEQQLDQWMKGGTVVTVFSTSPNAIPFVQDPNAKDENGKPKRYPTQGKLLTLGKNSLTIGTMITWRAYALVEASQADLKVLAEKAHGAYLSQQSVYKKRSNAKRIAKQGESMAKRKAAAKESTKKGKAA